MTFARSVLLFALAAVAESGGAWFVWQGLRQRRGWLWIGAGMVALGAYGCVATLSRTPTSARSSPRTEEFVAGSLARGMALDGLRRSTSSGR